MNIIEIIDRGIILRQLKIVTKFFWNLLSSIFLGLKAITFYLLNSTLGFACLSKYSLRDCSLFTVLQVTKLLFIEMYAGRRLVDRAWSQTLNFGMLRWLLYHCATTTSQGSTQENCVKFCKFYNIFQIFMTMTLNSKNLQKLQKCHKIYQAHKNK
jgi:hypothetical protein